MLTKHGADLLLPSHLLIRQLDPLDDRMASAYGLDGAFNVPGIHGSNLRFKTVNLTRPSIAPGIVIYFGFPAIPQSDNSTFFEIVGKHCVLSLVGVKLLSNKTIIS